MRRPGPFAKSTMLAKLTDLVGLTPLIPAAHHRHALEKSTVISPRLRRSSLLLHPQATFSVTISRQSHLSSSCYNSRSHVVHSMPSRQPGRSQVPCSYRCDSPLFCALSTLPPPVEVVWTLPLLSSRFLHGIFASLVRCSILQKPQQLNIDSHHRHRCRSVRTTWRGQLTVHRCDSLYHYMRVIAHAGGASTSPEPKPPFRHECVGTFAGGCRLHLCTNSFMHA